MNDKEKEKKLKLAREAERKRKISYTKTQEGARPKVSLPTFSWEKEKQK